MTNQILFLIFFFFALIPPVHAQMELLKEDYEEAIAAFNNHQYDQAMNLYQQIIKAVPNFAPAYNGMALVNQAEGGDEDKTIEYLKMAVGYDPHMTQAFDNLGRIYYGRQDMDQAQKYFERALQNDPNLASAQICLAWINLLVLSKPELAIKYFKEVLKVSQDPKIYYGLGSAYFASNQRTKALEMITQLRLLGQEKLAVQLEQSMRENAYVNTDAGAQDVNQSSQHPGLGPLPATVDAPTGTQVHLRGKLSDY